MSIFRKSAEFAKNRHAGQLYGGGDYYWNHLIPVRDLVIASGFGSETMMAAAILHDVVEDTTATLEDLEQFGPTVVAIVDRLTRRDGERYKDYVERATSFHDSAVIKACDAACNLRCTMKDFEPGEKTIRRIRRYSKTIGIVHTMYGFCF